MTNYYVRADATSDSNTGLGNTAATAKKTLNGACAVAGAGDTVYVMDAGGTFFVASEHQFTPVGAAGNLLYITAYPGQRPTFDGTGGTFGSTDAILSIKEGAAYADIGGFIIQNCAQGSALGRGLEISSAVAPAKVNHITIRDMLIQEIWERGAGGGGDQITFNNVEVYHFAMRNFEQALGSGGWATGIASFSYGDGTFPVEWTVQNCYVHNGWGEGFNLLRAGDGSTTGWILEDSIVENAFSKLIYLDKSQNCIIRRNKALFNDVTYQRDSHNSDGITLSGESSPLHGDTHEVVNVKIYMNQVMGARDAFTWFQDTNAVGNSYADVWIFHNSTYGIVRSAMRFEAVAALAAAPSGCLAYNNIYDGTMTTHANPAAWTFSNNIWIDGIPALDTHTSSLHANPRYVDPGTSYASVLTIRDDSPALGVGTNATLSEVPADFIGIAYTDPPSIGCYAEGVAVGGESQPAQVYGQVTSFLTGTGAVASTFEVALDVEWTPVAAIFFWNGMTEDVDTAASQDAMRGIGFSTGPAANLAMTNFVDDGAAVVTDTAQRNTNAACVSVLANSTTRDGELKVNQFSAGKIVMEVVDQFATQRRIFVLALGGDELQAQTFTFSAPTSAGSAASLTGLSFQPDGLILANTGTNAATPSTGVDSRFALGFVDALLNQAVWCGGSNDGAATSATISYCKSGECIAAPNGSLTSTTLRAACTAFNTDGATFNWTEVSGTATVVMGLALKGGEIMVGNFTGATPVTVDLGFTAVGLLACSAWRAESASDTVTAEDVISLGMASGPVVTQASIALWDENGVVASGDVNVGMQFDDLGIALQNDGTFSANEIVLSAINDEDIQVAMAGTAETSFFFYFAIGNAFIPGGGSGSGRDHISPFIRLW